jgi:hypothetical protein
MGEGKVGVVALAEAIEALGKLKQSFADTTTDSKAAVPSPPSDASEIGRMAASIRAAGDAFKRTFRWMTGSVALLGVLLFGSGPFLTGGTLKHPFSKGGWPVTVGLALIAIGLISSIIAATRVYEPEDASLGELIESFKELDDPAAVMSPARRESLTRFKQIVTGPEASAHLGPDILTLESLVATLGELDKTSLAADVERAGNLVRLDAVTARWGGLSADRKAVQSDLASSRDRVVKNDEIGYAAVEQARRRNTEMLMARLERIDVALSEADAELVAAQQALAVVETKVAQIESKRQTYLAHRTIVLGESVVAQMRGTFRSARTTLAAGALFTLVGGVLYVSGLSEKDGASSSDKSDAVRQLVLPATLTVKSSATIATQIPVGCVDIPLQSIYGSLTLPGPKKAYSITVVGPSECRMVLAVPAKDNAIADGAQSPAVLLEVRTP